MTDLQVKFQTLNETKRHNLATEDLSGREVSVKEAKLDPEIASIIANTELTKVKKVNEIVSTIANGFHLTKDAITSVRDGLMNAIKHGKTLTQLFKSPVRNLISAWITPGGSTKMIQGFETVGKVAKTGLNVVSTLAALA